METPVGGCVLSAVEKVFAITKSRFRTWLQQQWGQVHGEMTVRQLNTIFNGIHRAEGKRIAKSCFSAYHDVLEGFTV